MKKKTVEKIKEFKDWDERYRNEKAEKLPWFLDELDHDFARALSKWKLPGKSVLDLGAGPGTQSIEMAKKGYQVTAWDISPAALKGARQRARREKVSIKTKTVSFPEKCPLEMFDLILDRGCFHTFDPQKRTLAVQKLFFLLRPGGFFFLKTFSAKEKREGGPYRFTSGKIRKTFEAIEFKVHSIIETKFRGDNAEEPKGLFSVLQRPIKITRRK